MTDQDRTALEKEVRRNIGRHGAEARWGGRDKLPKVTHNGTLVIGEIEIPCSVLSDGTRLITQRGFMGAMGYSGGRKPKSEGDRHIPIFLDHNSIKPLIINEENMPDTPVCFVASNGAKAYGYKAELLPRVCDIFMEARKQGLLPKNQMHIAERAEILVRALAQVGIVALIDEATGYQETRARNALHELLSKYLSEERLAWARTFPDEFYKQIYRLRGWEWSGKNAKPPLVGKLTNEVVYERLPEGVLQALKELNPVDADTKRRKHKHHQFLSTNIGQPDLNKYITQLVPVMRLCQTWEELIEKIEVALPPGALDSVEDENKHRLKLAASEV